jgi:SRSO17 transposase
MNNEDDKSGGGYNPHRQHVQNTERVIGVLKKFERNIVAVMCSVACAQPMMGGNTSCLAIT